MYIIQYVQYSGTWPPYRNKCAYAHAHTHTHTHTHQASTDMRAFSSLMTPCTSGLPSIRFISRLPDDATIMFITQLATGWCTANRKPPVWRGVMVTQTENNTMYIVQYQALI